jgi:hypothetical protein
MTRDEKLSKLASMPQGYKPREAEKYLALYFTDERSFNRLSDEQAGKVLKRLFRYARDYAESYDSSLEPDFDGLDAGAAMLMDSLAASIQRIYDGRRETSFLRSGANEGGRPSKT